MDTARAYFEAFEELGSFAAVGRRFGVSRSYVHKVLRDSDYDIPVKQRKFDTETETYGLLIPRNLLNKFRELAGTTHIPINHHIEKALQYYIDNHLYETLFNDPD